MLGDDDVSIRRPGDYQSVSPNSFNPFQIKQRFRHSRQRSWCKVPARRTGLAFASHPAVVIDAKMTVVDEAETRKTKRQRVLAMALIRFGDMSISCTVRNISEEGAALDIGRQLGIPDCFTLIVTTQIRKRFSCSVVWRDKRRIGVVFL